MPIRDVVLVAFIFCSVPVCFWRPYYGVLIWTWISFMSPHRLGWGFAYAMPLAQIVAIPMIAGLLFTRDRRPIPVVSESVLLGAFWGLTLISTLFSWYPEQAWSSLEQFSKVLLVVFITICLVQDRQKLHSLLLVAAVSIGFYGFKGGLWSLANGGAGGMVLGPAGSFFEDNNGLSLALNMTLPILFYLAREEQRIWLRRTLSIAFVFTVPAVIFTYSRSGFLGLIVVLFIIVARSRWKTCAIAVVCVSVVILSSFVPHRWFERMNTISTYEEDRSAMSRIYAWKLGLQIAIDSPLVGGGFGVFPHDEIWAKYAPEYYFGLGKEATNRTPNAHSIYFHVLGEHGFTGFIIFAGLIAATLLSLRRIRRYSRAIKDGSWLINYTYMVDTSLAAFLITGAFQNLTYFDLFYFLVGVTIILKRLAMSDVCDGDSATAVSVIATQRQQSSVAARRRSPSSSRHGVVALAKFIMPSPPGESRCTPLVCPKPWSFAACSTHLVNLTNQGCGAING